MHILFGLSWFSGEEISLSLQEEIKWDKGYTLKISTSHGMAINFLKQLLQKNKNIKTGSDVHGSLESLRLLNQSNYDVAGFHYPLGNALGDTLASIYRQYLNPDRHELLLVATREQGIITDVNNSVKVKTLSDLSNRAVRFINRQHDSGTRIILDQLLTSSNINAMILMVIVMKNLPSSLLQQ